MAAISQYATALKKDYVHRHIEASAKRTAVYNSACEKLATVPGWADLSKDQQAKLVSALKVWAAPASAGTGLALLRSDIDACPGRTQKIIEEMLRLMDGARLVRIEVGRYFSGSIDTTEQLDASIDSLREECERQIAEGKRILIQ